MKHQVGPIETQIAEVREAQIQQAERIDAVDRRAKEGLDAAGRAASSAAEANRMAVEVNQTALSAERRADAAQQGVRRATDRINVVESRLANLDKYIAGPSEK